MPYRALALSAGKTWPQDTDAAHAERLVVLSPHFDDACFSMGAFLDENKNGTLIDIFTNSNFLASGNPHFGITAQEVSDIRNREDKAFALLCRLKRHLLCATEPPLLGRPICGAAHIEDDIAAIAPPLHRLLLEETAPSDAKGRLFAPAGIGGHANHLAVCEWILRNLDSLCAAYDVFLYEDLPYAAHADARWHRLTALGRDPRIRLGGRLFRRLRWAQKKPLVECYPTQLRHPPTAMRFRPAAPWPFAVHEAFWPIRPRNPR